MSSIRLQLLDIRICTVHTLALHFCKPLKMIVLAHITDYSKQHSCLKSSCMR